MDPHAHGDSRAAHRGRRDCEFTPGNRSGKALLAKTKTDPSEIDLIIVASVTPDMFFPATACLVQDRLGAKRAWGFDLSAACSGFAYALTVGAQFVGSGAHRKVVVIGSDCFDITPKIIKQAFDVLPQNNFVIGPTHDGGYYLLGMTALHTTLFKNKKWSSEDVFHDTLIDIRNMNGSYKLLPELTDIDTEEDLLASNYSFSG